MSISSCLLAFCACTSPAIFDGSKGVVRYQQFNSDNGNPPLKLALVQETNTDYDRILSEKEDNVFVKIITIDKWKYLIEELVDECGFLELIESAPPWERVTSPSVISVENEFGKWTLQSEHCIGECDGYNQDNYFAEMVEVFRYCFDNTFVLQPLEDKDKNGVEFFKEEQERLNKNNKRRTGVD